MLIYKPLPAFHIVTKRANMALIVFSRMLKNLGETSGKIYQTLEPASIKLSKILAALALPFCTNQPNTLALAPHPLTIQPI